VAYPQTPGTQHSASDTCLCRSYHTLQVARGNPRRLQSFWRRRSRRWSSVARIATRTDKGTDNKRLRSEAAKKPFLLPHRHSIGLNNVSYFHIVVLCAENEWWSSHKQVLCCSNTVNLHIFGHDLFSANFGLSTRGQNFIVAEPSKSPKRPKLIGAENLLVYGK